MTGGGRRARVVRAGALTTPQDGGRPGFAHLGVPRSGALDAGAHHLANRLVGNAERSVVLETTLDGVALAFEAGAVVAVTGAWGAVALDGTPVAWGLPVGVPPGATLDVGPAQRGVRSYLAVAGGWQVPVTLGSASTDLLSGLGPAPLAAGDVLAIGPVTGRVVPLDMAPYPLPAASLEVVVRLGPRHDWLSPAGRATLGSGAWTVTPDSNRIALRLHGPPVDRRRAEELPSEGLVVGAVQVVGNGQLIVFLADHPTTGGYPVAAVVDPASIAGCAQARPGTTVTFRVRPPAGGR
jgi:biotin-dependent carboxylase-like uncharacterized protein